MIRYWLLVYRADNQLVLSVDGRQIEDFKEIYANPGAKYEFTDEIKPDTLHEITITGMNWASSKTGWENPYHFQYAIVATYPDGHSHVVAEFEKAGPATEAYGGNKVEISKKYKIYSSKDTIQFTEVIDSETPVVQPVEFFDAAKVVPKKSQ